MPKKLVFKLMTSIFLLSLITACGTVNENEVNPPEDPQVDPIEDNTPIDFGEDFYEPTRNEMNENFGKEIEGNIEEFPDDYLEKDEDTPSSP